MQENINKYGTTLHRPVGQLQIIREAMETGYVCAYCSYSLEVTLAAKPNQVTN